MAIGPDHDSLNDFGTGPEIHKGLRGNSPLAENFGGLDFYSRDGNGAGRASVRRMVPAIAQIQ
jgi:hypothetical protein